MIMKISHSLSSFASVRKQLLSIHCKRFRLVAFSQIEVGERRRNMVKIIKVIAWPMVVLWVIHCGLRTANGDDEKCGISVVIYLLFEIRLFGKTTINGYWRYSALLGPFIMQAIHVITNGTPFMLPSSGTVNSKQKHRKYCPTVVNSKHIRHVVRRTHTHTAPYTCLFTEFIIDVYSIV